jgi:osmotically-inducible protein OsmY
MTEAGRAASFHLLEEIEAMAQNYRNQSGRPDYGRGGRYPTGAADRDRYQTGGEQQFSPDWEERDRPQSFEGNRSYSAGGYSEEFGSRRHRNREEQDRDFGKYQSRGSSGANYTGYSGYGRGGYAGDDYGSDRQSSDRPSRYEEGRFDEANRWSEGAGRRDFDDFRARDRGTTTSSWHEDQGDGGGLFQTGSYVDDGGASRGFGADFERARAQMERQRYGRSTTRGTSGDYSHYGQSAYGSQSGYSRDESGDDERSWRNSQRGGERGYPAGNYQSRSSWDYGQQQRGERAGSGSGSGGYDYDAGYRSNIGSSAGSQSHRGRGPQGYQRSDDRLKEMVCERLTDDPYIDASNITVEVTGQVVKLSGTVDDRGTKYEIEELVERLGGVKDIDNQLRVQSASKQTTSSQSNTSGQQLRGGSDWDAGSSSSSSSGTTTRTGASAAGSTTTPGSGLGSSKRN